MLGCDCRVYGDRAQRPTKQFLIQNLRTTQSDPAKSTHLHPVWWVVHAWVGQIVTFFAYRPPSRPLGSLTPTQPGRVTNPTQGHPEPPWEAPQAECWLLRREPKPPA